MKCHARLLCKHMLNIGTCPYGQQCTFAHSDEGLRSWLTVQAGANKVPNANAVVGGAPVNLEFRYAICSVLVRSS